MKNIFTSQVTEEVIDRINRLTPQTQPKWGKMNVAQMLAHCNVTYEMVYEDKHKKPSGLMKFFLKAFVKSAIVGEKPFKQSLHTAPQFIIADQRDFMIEKKRLIDFLHKTQQLGESHFEGKESHSFGKLTAKEWNVMFYKHLDHHLTQFGV